MITINLKPCCYKCKYPDINIETQYVYDRCDHPIACLSTIYCTHSRVCKNYIESEDE